MRLPTVLLTIILAITTLSCTKESGTFTDEVLNSYTPIKRQGADNNFCWAYAMLAAIETENISKGDSVHLSVAWISKMTESDPRAPKSCRGVAGTLLNSLERYGIVPFNQMPTTDDPLPSEVILEGETLTPLEYAARVSPPGYYIGLGSTSSVPEGEEFVAPFPDNWEDNTLLNMEMDSILKTTEKAVRGGRGVCWEGDTSERGFKREKGVARIGLIGGKTSDNHCMAIVGIARDSKGKPYFIMKNSWGTKNPYGGLFYMSYPYFMRKTVAVYLPKDCLTL
ncbi:MAG: hypothetical protein IJL91_14455 [Bacteroidales bacterium]|nr:hypothetical protein [Bacteroidales bacterium]